MRQWTAPPTPPPALIIAVAMALMGLCSVWHAFPTAQQLRMLCRLSCSMQPWACVELRRCAVLCGAARGSWPCQGAALRCGLICQAFMFYGDCSALCLSARLLSEPFIPGPQRASAQGSSRARRGAVATARRGAHLAARRAGWPGRCAAAASGWEDDCTRERSRHTLRRGRRCDQCAEACF